MIKTIPRSYVDLNNSEVLISILSMINPIKYRCSTKNAEFEKAFAGYIGTRYAVSFPYCRAGMYFALKALNLNEGEEVILPAFTFWVDAAMVELAGLKPVFVDVDFETLSLDPKLLESAITSKTKVIFPTNLNGLSCDLDPIIEIAKKNKLRVIEDCARSCGILYKGKKAGSSDIGAFSFGYGKSFYDFHGAMITSNDKDFIQKLLTFKEDFKKISLKSYYIETIKGLILKYVNNPYIHPHTLYPTVYKFQVEGREEFAKRFRVKMPAYESVPSQFKIHLTKFQSSIGMSQLKKIDETNKIRLENVEILNRELSKIKEIHICNSNEERPNYAIHYIVWTERKNELQKYLTKAGIDAQDETAVNTAALERFKKYAKGSYPNSDKLHDKILFLPTHPYLEKKDMLFMVEKIKEFFGKC